MGVVSTGTFPLHPEWHMHSVAYILALVLLVASVIIAVVRQSVSAETLALWAIGVVLILPKFVG